MPKDKKVVLFGRTGDGKSTIANVLVTGGIENEIFKTSDGVKGCTFEIQKEAGRGWIVTDTVGLGEAEAGTVPTPEAINMLTEFLVNVSDEYSHIIYVKNSKRITTLDEMTWLLFTRIFVGAEAAFVVLFTGADEEWLQDNRDKLPEYLKNQKILVSNIPPISKRKITEKNQKVIRQKNIEKLEADLEKVFLQGGSMHSTPRIATMNKKELETESRSIVDFTVYYIRSLFNASMWINAALKLTTLINVADIILTHHNSFKRN